ncbi:uncharacterized protein LOC126993241 isoform X2 [Eriocheir sinensis]|uniref:uncharacterized protein LOC126993241 isoform X2 n=1 Tax=Eriocheir sinensis TaxID=95602 RepID=UPI0021C6F74A|nr:uncharacterized protein LOC126993241 isoform X2 [Eriocheir sinensis]
MGTVERDGLCTPPQEVELDGSSSAATSPGEAATTTTATTVTTGPLDTPTTPLPPPSPHAVTTTENSFPVEPPVTPPPPFSALPNRMRMMSPPGPPPSYDECHNLNTPPPTYDSLFGRVREVHKTSTGIMDFIKNLIILFLGTIGCTVMISVTIVIPVMMIIVGSLKMNDCPAQPYIPVYLVVGGVMGVAKNLLGIQGRLHHPLTDEEAHVPIPWHRRLQFGGAINFFLTVWFVMGCVWVYRIYKPNYTDRNTREFCDQTLYQFAFWLVTSVYLIIGLLISCMCGLSIATVILQHGRETSEQV